MPLKPLTRLRKLCLSFPDTSEKISWGEPTFRVGGKVFAMYASAGTHHSPGGDSVWLMNTPVNQGFLLAAKPKRFYKPPYAGPFGWIGVRLDGRVNWKEVAELVKDAYDLRVAKSSVQRSKRSGSGRG